MKNIPNDSEIKITIDKLLEVLKNNSTVSLDKIDELKKSISSFKYYTISKNNFIKSGIDNNNLYYFSISSRTKRNIWDISKIFISCFGKKFPLVIELKYANNIYFEINSGYLKDENIDLLVNKKTLKIGPLNINDVDEKLDFNDFLNTSIKNLFNDIVYKFIFTYILDVQKEYKRYIPYETLIEYSKINSLEREINGIKRKIKKEFNLPKKTELNSQLQEKRKNVNEIKERFDVVYNSIV